MVKEKKLPVRLDRHTEENLKRVAEAEGRTRAGLIRWLVNCYASGELVVIRQQSARRYLTDRAPEATYTA